MVGLALQRTLALALMLFTTSCAHYTPEQQVRDYIDLCETAREGDFAEAQRLLRRGAPTEPIDPMAHPLAAMAVNMDPPILSSAERGDLAMVELLLDHGAYPDSRCCSSDSGLGAAAAAGHVEVVQLLLENGADPTISGMKGRSPIELARKGGHAAIVQQLTRALQSTPE
ncbi:MAG: hypothetical protein GY946_13910 [bacterium]|nr:hypothetical protein [bacterium]